LCCDLLQRQKVLAIIGVELAMKGFSLGNNRIQAFLLFSESTGFISRSLLGEAGS